MTGEALIHLSLPFSEPEALLLSVAFVCTEQGCVVTQTAYQTPQYGQIIAADNFQHLHALQYIEFAQRIAHEIQCYLTMPEFCFTLDCELPLGTAFQQRVWQALTAIPTGEVMTYGALAKQLNSSARAVGNACRRNRFPLLIPCHRVVSAAGIGGYAGDTLEKQRGRIHFLQIKQWLLTHEQAAIG